ncbi:MAG: hypothetical protein QM589_17955 [Thermomicrobiales bacterium]
MNDDPARDEHDDDLETPLGKACTALFAPRIEDDEIDVVELPDDDAVEIQADEWTLHLQGDPIVLAFVAIENEPEAANDLAQALRATLTPDDLAALETLDSQLGGALASRLTASGDALSQTMAAMLTASRPSTP